MCALLSVAALASLPAAATARAARSGSVGIGVTGGSGAPATTPSQPTTSVAVVKLTGAVSAQGDGITIRVAASGTLSHPLMITGVAPPGDAGEVITIQTETTTGGWTRVATAVIGQGGSFSTTWTPVSSAQVKIRAVLAPKGSTATGGGVPGADSAATASTVFATEPLTIPIFKNAVATIFGPGLWGRHTACGERLGKATLGVASRTLKCGSRVAVYYHGRELTVPVVDRGPFTKGVTWDLTLATARALGITETSTVGTLTPAPASLTAL